MAPTTTSAMIYSKEHLTLTDKKDRKPVVEKLCRDRINSKILNQQSDSKLEKADILEMTVSIIMSRPPLSSLHCSKCVQEIVHFLRLLSHFQILQPSSDKNRRESDLSQMSPPPQHSISEERSRVNCVLWVPW
uniref:Uncharacterized protein n=1 Tax=Hucho hucho TaxID=62062 RepID=A0A4W5RH08_9TELE